MKYRKEVRTYGRGDVNDIDIIEAYGRDDVSALKDLLSERCLEYLTHKDMDIFLGSLHSRGWSIHKVLEKLSTKPNAKLLSTVL